jgi:hypothetical protein
VKPQGPCFPPRASVRRFLMRFVFTFFGCENQGDSTTPLFFFECLVGICNRTKPKTTIYNRARGLK